MRGTALQNPDTIKVLSVAPGSAADSAGIRAGDAITAVNNVSVAVGHLGVFDLAPLERTRTPFELTLRRDGRTMRLKVD